MYIDASTAAFGFPHHTAVVSIPHLWLWIPGYNFLCSCYDNAQLKFSLVPHVMHMQMFHLLLYCNTCTDSVSLNSPPCKQ